MLEAYEKERTRFSVRLANRAGALVDVLDLIKRRDVNLTEIKSRPVGMWEYEFSFAAEGKDLGLLFEDFAREKIRCFPG